MASWLQTGVAGVVAGLAVGLIGVAVQLAYRHGRRLDLVPVVTATAVALAAARLSTGGQSARLVDGSVLVPLAALVGGLVHVLVVDRPRAGGPAVREVLVPVAVAVAGEAAIAAAVGGRVFAEAVRGDGVSWRGVTVLTWAEVAAALVVLVAAAVVAVASTHGRTGLRLRAGSGAPELLPLSGVEPSRLGARLAALAAAAGGAGGLVLASVGPVPNPGLGDIGLRSVEALLIGGVRHPRAVLAGGCALELTRVLVERATPGWGPAAGHGLALAVLAARLATARRPARPVALALGDVS